MNRHDVREGLAKQIEAVGLFLSGNCELLTTDIEENYLERDGLTISVDIDSPSSIPRVNIDKTFVVPVPSNGQDIQL